jgi:hypothetical protein
VTFPGAVLAGAVPGTGLPGGVVPGVRVPAAPGVPVPVAGVAPGTVVPASTPRLPAPTRGELTPHKVIVRSDHAGSVNVGQVAVVNVAWRIASGVTSGACRAMDLRPKSTAVAPQGTARNASGPD